MASKAEKKLQVKQVVDPGSDLASTEATAQSLRDREERLIAEILANFRNLVMLATEPIGSSASAGQAAYSSMAMEIETKGLIKSAEDLLQLTRLLRELWIIGPLRKPGEGEREAEVTIEDEVRGVVGILGQMREKSRQDLVGQGIGQAILGQGSYTASGSEAKGDSAPAQSGAR
ncbi:hypothetical protein BR93DRAFT_972581 [Coniochaeta sp. PMI_546]|nr:hypothetical protein BR93DRAFT_972581 [Coniochaeta sp. PMI_546]